MSADGFDFKELDAFSKMLDRLEQDTPEIMSELVVGEGVYAVKQARIISKNEKGLFNTGAYLGNFHAGNKAMASGAGADYDGSPMRRNGEFYTIDVYNNLEYAKHLEYGFRSHFVPGYWAGRVFVYQRGASGGMYVGTPGSYVPGHFTLRRAENRTLVTQEARLQRKIDKILKDRFGRWRRYL